MATQAFLPGFKGLKGHRGHKEIKGHKEIPDPQEQQARQDCTVSVIAIGMVANGSVSVPMPVVLGVRGHFSTVMATECTA